MADLDNQLALDLLEQGLADFDQNLQERVFPEIVIGEFVDIKPIQDLGLDKNIYGELDGRGSLDDGLIGDKTSSLITTDVNVALQESPIVTWAKSTQWNIIELAKASRLGIPLDTVKLDNLAQNAMQTIQKVGFVGHAEDSRITGLLNSLSVAVDTSITIPGTIDSMTPEQAIQFFVDIFLAGYEKTGGALMPGMLGIDSFDLAKLAAKSAGQRASDGKIISTLYILNEQLELIAGHPVMIRGIPNKYAQKVANETTNRAVVYTRDPSVVEYPVMYPQTQGIHQFNILTFQSALLARFGSVDFKDPQLAAYVDYPRPADPANRSSRVFMSSTAATVNNENAHLNKDVNTSEVTKSEKESLQEDSDSKSKTKKSS